MYTEVVHKFYVELRPRCEILSEFKQIYIFNEPRLKLSIHVESRLVRLCVEFRPK